MIGVVFTIVLAIAPAAFEDQAVTVTLAMTSSAGQDPGQDPAKPAPAAQPSAAQDAPAPMKIVSPPVTPVTMTSAERHTFRESISNMESLLAQAVNNGARRLLVDNPGMTLVPAGQPRARGFALDGYGLFFDVEI